MSNDRSTSPITVPDSATRPRRGSIASGLPFNDLFSKQSSSSGNPASSAHANQQRRLSITTLGLSGGSPTQTSAAFGSQAFRRGSLSSSWGSIPNNEEAVTEDPEGSSPSATPNSPFARRVSFGAQALREARAGSIGNGEGFNWSEALRHRAERAPSLGGPISPAQAAARQSGHQRAASIASMEQPVRELPRQPKQNKPDFFQEKILRGDFMD
ncbi:hypothetical protein N7462_011564 [Penicillium macrosclerotiorum]|uniref:uncharacterized protein n=1 Tax=Penicillium macrosclerotiorum TaxID=303699 RepID=UPI00254967B5|nr:uncharacterized protein N7462_011564 [Penicillium macrosclerotiorum]KAJ5664751.1 hypothetical protein N7462_011564 [Penicillium macrosclerotiorum]